MKRLLALFFLTSCLNPAGADVHLPAIFGTNMVLQQDLKLPVWGTADAGEAVTVTLGTHTAKATADAQGKWRVDLDPVPVSSTPMTLTVAGKNTVTFDNVLVGDVWVCSGQSNMEFDLGAPKTFGGAANAGTAIPAANDPQLRLFIVTKKIALQPEADVTGEWKVCTPESAGFFSAVGYFFGQELRKSLNKPIGLIGTYWGGQPAQAFTSLSGLQKDPPFSAYIAAYDQLAANHDAAVAAFPAAEAAYKLKIKAWQKGEGATFMAKLEQWKKDTAAAQAAGQPLPGKLRVPASAPKPPPSPDGGPSTPTVLYNGMIAPLIPYAIKGAIWYQGEANAAHADEYKTLFPRMISDWREKWGQGDFPFLFVQLAAFMAPQKEPSEDGGWPLLREAQLQTLSVPNTGMALAIDVGNPKDVHPKDKLDVGLRLALAAKHVAYGQDLVYSGPIYDSMKIDGKTIRVSFKNTGTGIKPGTPPWTWSGVPATPSDKLVGFAIAGADQKFVWADAKIDGDTIVVSSDAVTSPVAVRYDWANDPAGNLYNKEDLPASPFRTDDWAMAPAVPVTKPAATSAPGATP